MSDMIAWLCTHYDLYAVVVMLIGVAVIVIGGTRR